MAKIVCVSDLHQNLPDIPECDLLLIAGDLTFGFKGDVYDTRKWLVGPFKRWADDVPAKHIVAVAGNHDQTVQQLGWPNNSRVRYLEDSGTQLQGLNIWGTPWQPWFYSWAFNAPQRNGEDFLAEKFRAIPDDTDIIICHGPPRGYGDSVGDPNVEDRSGQPKVGSTALLDAIDRVKPRLMVCGHIHSGRGEFQRGDTKIVNAAIVNNEYEAIYPPAVVTLERRTGYRTEDGRSRAERMNSRIT